MKTDLPLKREPEFWECPYCVKPVGLIGNWLSWWFGTRIHKCNWANVDYEVLPNGMKRVQCTNGDVLVTS